MARTQQQAQERVFVKPVHVPKEFDYTTVDVRKDGSKSDVHLLERVEFLEIGNEASGHAYNRLEALEKRVESLEEKLSSLATMSDAIKDALSELKVVMADVKSKKQSIDPQLTLTHD